MTHDYHCRQVEARQPVRLAAPSRTWLPRHLGSITDIRWRSRIECQHFPAYPIVPVLAFRLWVLFLLSNSCHPWILPIYRFSYVVALCWSMWPSTYFYIPIGLCYVWYCRVRRLSARWVGILAGLVHSCMYVVLGLGLGPWGSVVFQGY